eukprot:TRINITY_DN24428_c0_g1_i1.p1 TRINITY_DN24428_c0_g1~~TRINITY_DN24428_c0_g1_i1.p1  ORF type:complete len:145 (+),score=37.98 TRINITY_DN24428_c0_g1_i1:89-523(+)
MLCAAAARRHDHGAFLFAVPHVEMCDGTEPGHTSGEDLLFGKHELVLRRAKSASSAQLTKIPVHEAGVLPHLTEDAGILKALKATVLITGSLCSKLFGVGIMGYLLFQSMRTNEQTSKERDEDLTGLARNWRQHEQRLMQQQEG